MTRRNRTAAILAAVLALILLFSALFIVLEADHDCHGENCRVCMQIRLCEGLLRQAAVFLAVMLAEGVLRALFRAGKAFLRRTAGAATLIKLKVKLSD